MRFWDLSYAAGDHGLHWEGSSVCPALAALVSARAVRAGARALDVGCGGGREAIFLARAGLRVTGLDLSTAALAVARGRASRAGVTVDWCRGSVLEPPLAPGSTALAVDRGCFHHLPPHRRSTYGAVLARLLAPGGLLVLQGAAVTDEEGGLVGVDGTAVADAFPADHFAAGRPLPTVLEAPSGGLPGNVVVLTRRNG